MKKETKEIEVVSPYKVKKVLFQRKYSGYLYRRELVDDSEYGGDGKLEMVNCYSRDTGHWLGNAGDARRLCRQRGLSQIQKARPSSCVATIGFDAVKQRWSGWSHRASCSFGIGDKIFEHRFGNDSTPFIKHGKKTIRSLADAKLAAKRFAAYVS